MRPIKENVMNRAKWIALCTMVSTGGLLLGNGCLTAFWQGFTTGFPANNRWLNLAVDVAHAVVLG
jgi:hypothetical protein